MIARRSHLMAGLVLLTAACRGDGPFFAHEPPPLDVTVRITQVLPPEMFALPDGPLIVCGVDLATEVTGRGRGRWVGGVFRWYAGVERTTVLDSVRYGGISTRAAWQSDTIRPGHAEYASWDIYARAPFDAELRFLWLDLETSVVDTAQVRFSCGPRFPAEGAAPPTVQLAFITTRPELEPGDTVQVTFAATSPFGLWSSSVTARGAFDAALLFSDLMTPAASHTAIFEVPKGGALGVPLTIDLRGTDGALQATTVTVPTSMIIVDRRAPLIVSHGPVSGDYAVGSTFHISALASDNNQLAWLIYEFGAPVNIKDSVRVAAEVPTSEWNIPFVVQPSWVGTPTLSFFVRDAAGNASAPVEAPAGGLRFVSAP